MPLLAINRKVKLADRHYQIVAAIGQGGSGEVFEVTQAERRFAMKGEGEGEGEQPDLTPREIAVGGRSAPSQTAIQRFSC